MVLGFKPRSQARDQETDLARFQALSSRIADAITSIENEMKGLEARYRRAADSAAFSLQSYENDRDSRLSRQADELTRSMTYCKGRIDTLRQQVAFLRQKQAEVEGAGTR
jgi:predicted  nucleic acid-binding Zn-ribbon protein